MSKRRVNLIDVFLVLLAITVASLFLVPVMLFLFIAGFTAIIGLVCLVMVWDEIVAWWSTRK